MAKKDQNTITVTMRQKKTTPGAIAFVELDGDGNPLANPTEGKIGGIYLRKSSIEGPIPNEITVSVSW